jgi:signal transduction histidine kinase
MADFPESRSLLWCGLIRVVRLGAIAALAVWVCAAGAPHAQEEPHKILLIHSYGYDSPGRFVFDAGFAQALSQVTDLETELFVETIDGGRFRGTSQMRMVREYLRERYANKKISAVVAVYDRALAFLLDNDEPLFPGVPVAAVLTGDPISLPDRISAIWSGVTYGESVALALSLLPGTRQIALIDGAPTPNSAVYDEALKQVTAAAKGRPIVSLRDLPLDVLLTRVRSLPSDTIAIIVRQLLGRHGEVITNAEATAEIVGTAPVPVFVGTDQLIGTGAVGGVVINVDSEARQLAQLAVSVVRNPSTHRPLARGAPAPVFDWRALKRWGIDELRVPEGSTVRFRQATVWEQYQHYIISAVGVVLFQAALIAGLVVQRIRRRRIESALRESETRYRMIAEQNQDLVGRLINAQEVERARIARDLHDDLSQQLAGLAIMLSNVKRAVSASDGQREARETVITLQERTSTLAQAVRNLSHELHPSVLSHQGLVATLRRHCADLERFHRLEISVTAAEGADALSPDVALCLFRVAQETISNTVRHAHAGRVAVELAPDNTGIEMRVSDDGIGFVPSEHASTGLGLRSIDERVRLIGGALRVDSQPGQGTRVAVYIPFEAAPYVAGNTTWSAPN